MLTFGVREAKQQFALLLDEVEAGQEITITRNNRPIAWLVPVRNSAREKAGQEALAEMIELMEKGLDLDDRRHTRDDMHND